MGKSILVTGGAGFIGSNFVKMILGSDSQFADIDNVSVLDALDYSGNIDNLREVAKDGRFKFISGQIQDKDLVDQAIKGIDVIFNFAAKSHVDRSISNPTPFIETNVLGTQILLQSARENSVPTFIHISTDEVYGSILNGSFSEASQLEPNSPYAASKAASDLLCRSYFQTFEQDVRITRCTNNYGPNQFPEKFIPLLITNLLLGKKIPIYGTGNQIRDWLHVEDHCRAIWKVYEAGSAGMVVNIGGGTELSNLTLANKLIKLMGKNEDSIEFVTDRPGHDQRYSLNYDYLKSLTNYEPKVAFDEGLVQTIQWYSENQSFWKSTRRN